MHKNHIRFWGIFIYALATLFCVYSCAVQVFPSVTVFPLMREFHLTAQGYGFLVSVYFYGYLLMQIPVGLLFDRLSKRILIFSAVVIVALGCLIFGFANSPFLIALARFLMGLGGSFSFIGLYVVIARWFPAHFFAFLAGLAQFFTTFGSLAGQIPFSFVIRDYGWRSAVQGLGWIGLAIAVLCILFVRRHPSHLIVPVAKKVSILRSLSSLLTKSRNWSLGIFAFCSWGPILIFAALWGVPFLMVRFGIPNTTAAIMTSVVWLGLGIFSPLMGWLSKGIIKRSVMMWGASLVGIILSCLVFYANLSIGWTVVLLFFLGGASGIHILPYAMAKEGVQKELVASSVSFINLILMLSGAILQPVTGVILQATGHVKLIEGMHMYTLYHYQRAFILIPILYFLAFCISAFFLKDAEQKAR